ncbi:MAG: helix-turn-helix domain-containing protein [Yoonia sp.]|uniref:helix-turn-helix domain-containing protein n=1 Tax=Yoonia sp. TaxID=2212373 RepID=UPI003EF3DA8E
MSTKKNARPGHINAATSSGTSKSDARNENDTDVIGKKVRALRTNAGFSVRGLAREASVSPSLVSQIELGRVQPSVDTLYSISNALNISVDQLFNSSAQDDADIPSGRDGLHTGPTQGVVRAADRQRIRLAGGIQWELLTPVPDSNLEFLRVVYEPGAASCPVDALVRHGGAEYAFIISGTLGLQVGFEKYELNAGDSMTFNADNPHRLWAIGDEPAVAVWVVINRQYDDRGLGR